jgi:hypothetical protein
MSDLVRSGMRQVKQIAGYGDNLDNTEGFDSHWSQENIIIYLFSILLRRVSSDHSLASYIPS